MLPCETERSEVCGKCTQNNSNVLLQFSVVVLFLMEYC